METNERAARRERAARAVREAEFSKARGGNFFERNWARARRWWYETNQNDVSLYVFAPTSAVRKIAQRLVASVWFDRVITCFIVANCVTLALYRPLEADGAFNKSLDVAETVFTVVFTLEFFAKIVAHNFVFGPHGSTVYMRDGWRALDFVVVVGGWVAVGATAAGGSGGGVTAIRGIRALRPLRSISGYPKLRVFVNTTIESMSMVVNVLFFLLVLLMVLGILGVQRYSGKLSHRCAYASTLQMNFDEIEFPCSDKRFGRQCGSSQVCISTSLNGVDGGFSTFNDVLGAGFIIYRIFTLRGWVDLMYQVIDGTGDRVMTIFYFVFSAAIGAIFISSFMLAAVTTKYRQTAILEEQKAGDDNVKEVDGKPSVQKVKSKRAGRFSYQRRFSEAMERPLGFMRKEFVYQKWLQKVVKHRYFDACVTQVILLNTVILAVQFRGMGDRLETTLTNLNYALLSVFVVEMLLKVLAFGTLGYVNDRFNVFDAVIVLAGLVEVGFGNSSLAVARAFRLLRVLRATRLITRNKIMRRLVDTTTQSFGAISSFCCVLMVFVFVFTILGMQLFGGAPEFRDVRPNFDSFGYSFLSVFEILTGSHWYKLMVIAMSGSKGGPASLFFIAWSFIGSLVLLNLVSGMLIDALSRVAKERELELARIAEEKLEQDRREQEAKRDADIKKLLLAKDIDDTTSFKQEGGDQDGLGEDSNTPRTTMKAKTIRQHPDAKRIMERINTRKQRKFQREVEVIERWLEIIGFTDENSEPETDASDDDIKDVNDELDQERQRMFAESANDDGTSAVQMTDTVVERIGAKVNAYIATGIPVPMDDRQVRHAYKRWRIDSAAEGDDSDEDVNILNATLHEDAYGISAVSMANKMEARKNLQENALAELRRNLLELGGDDVKEARQWASSAPITKAEKSAEARLHPKEQTAIIAQRRAQGTATGNLGKFKGEGMTPEGAAAIADANLVSMNVRQAAKNSSNNTPDRSSEARDDGDGEQEKAQSSGRLASWRNKIRAAPSGTRISQSLQALHEEPNTGPVTESFAGNNSPRGDVGDDVDTLSNSHSARSPRNSRSRGSQTIGDSAQSYNTLMPVVEYTTVPSILGVDYSLPRYQDDLQAGKSRKAMGLPVRDVVVDETRVEKSAKKTLDEEDWLSNQSVSNEEICMRYPSLGFIKPRLPLRRLLFMLIKNKTFEMLMLCLIILSCIQLSLDAPTLNPKSDFSAVLKAADVSFTLIFLCEAIIKIIAMGFVMHPGAYLRSTANCFDFFIVLVSVFVEVSNTSELKFMRSFRLFRALRPLRLINRVKRMRLLIATLIHVLPELGSMFLLGLFQFMIFAILGSQLFAGSFDYCNDTAVPDVKSCVGTFIDAKGAHLTRKWLHPPLNFDNTLISLLTLFVVVTRDGWQAIMFQGMDANGVDKQPSLNKSGWTAIYFVCFIIILSFVWLSMMVAIVCESYKRARELSSSTRTLTKEQQEWKEVFRIKARSSELRNVSDDYAGGAPRFFIRKSAFSLVTHRRFERFIIFCIIANTMTIATQHYGQSEQYAEIQRGANIAFSWIFLLELCFKLVALFPKRYFKQPWNVFDFIVVVSSIPDLAGVDFVGTNVLRVFRLGRVLRLFKQARGLRVIFNTCLLSFESAFHVIFLIFMLMFVYAVLGMNIFGDYDTHHVVGRVENFRNFGTSLLILLRVFTRDNWKRVMYDTMKCDYDVDDAVANCHRIVVPALYFTSFIMIGVYLLLSLIIAAILDTFTQNAIAEGLLSTSNIFVTIRRKLLLDTFSTKLQMKLEQLDVARGSKKGRRKR